MRRGKVPHKPGTLRRAAVSGQAPRAKPRIGSKQRDFSGTLLVTKEYEGCGGLPFPVQAPVCRAGYKIRCTNRLAASMAAEALRVGICWNTCQQFSYTSSAANPPWARSVSARLTLSDFRISWLPT